MNRIELVLERRTPGRKLLIPFFTAGFPDIATSRSLVEAAAGSGADMIEIGIPFSDPLADGPSIQYSSHVALQNGATLPGILNMVQAIRRTVITPIILMGYFNPIIAYGLTRSLEEMRRAGVDGLIIPDLPVDEAIDYCRQMRRNDLSAIFLVAPTSPLKRRKVIDGMSTDFVYAVTVTGVTGAGKVFDSETDTYLKSLKSVLNKPFVAGFGVRSPESAVRLTRYADGVVIGSALVEVVRGAGSRRKAVSGVERYLKTMRRALG